MDKNEVTGLIKEVEGAARGAIGQAVGDAKLQGHSQADGAVDKSHNYTRRGARRGSHEVRGPPRSEPDQNRPMSVRRRAAARGGAGRRPSRAAVE
jgi:uncharacterized protein YjbJ (UPF0337 family)